MGNKEFNYTYKAPTEEERREIESIKRQYEEPKTEEGKLERLRKLNNYVNGQATALALVSGILGLLIFGLGLTMVLEWSLLIWGIVVMVVGIPPMVVAYPLYNKILKRNKERYGKEILRLSEELLSEGIN
ncbi:MAG: hypothetical protein J6A53_06365 [Clostridia bacterium]|nr:hypothetical protein [Clostridia bacterium]